MPKRVHRKGVDHRAWIQGSEPGQRGRVGAERGRRSIGSSVQQRRKKTEWPMWPALSLEHVAADEAKIKRGKIRHHVNVLVRVAGP